MHHFGRLFLVVGLSKIHWHLHVFDIEFLVVGLKAAFMRNMTWPSVDNFDCMALTNICQHNLWPSCMTHPKCRRLHWALQQEPMLRRH